MLARQQSDERLPPGASDIDLPFQADIAVLLRSALLEIAAA